MSNVQDAWTEWRAKEVGATGGRKSSPCDVDVAVRIAVIVGKEEEATSHVHIARAWLAPARGTNTFFLSTRADVEGVPVPPALQKLLSPGGNASYYTYDASSNVSLKEMGGSVNSWASFDRADRMVALRYAKPDESTVAYFEYARDVAGRITRISRETDWAAYYDYDAIDRLTAARWRKNSDSSQIYAFTYEYDAANNRLRHRFEDSAGAEIESGYYSYDAANQLKQRLLQPYDLSTYYGYDANGAILREWDPVAPATTYYEYGANQLVSRVTPVSGSAWNFYYDGQLNRYRIDRGGTDSYMLWDGLNLLEERDGGGSLVARYTHGYSRLPGIGTIVEIYKPGTPDVTYYLCVDHRGTANVLLDEAGDEVGRREYDPFGRIVAESGSWPVDVGYQSNWLMVKIGNKWLCLSKYRIYDPELGIFLSRDFLPYPNKYRAFSNNPVKQVDNNGLGDSDLDKVAQAFEPIGWVALQIGRPFEWLGKEVITPAADWFSAEFKAVTDATVTPAVNYANEFVREHSDYIAGASIAVGGSVVVVCTGGIALPALLASLGASAKVIAVYEIGLVGAGVVGTGVSGYESFTGKNFGTGKPLSSFEKGQSNADLAIGLFGLGHAGTKSLWPRHLNIGSGKNPLKDAVNLDIKNQAGVDVVGDVKDLPNIFPQRHFTSASATNPNQYQPVIPEVAKVLRPGAKLEVTGQFLNKEVFNQAGVVRGKVPENPSPALSPKEISDAGFTFEGVNLLNPAYAAGSPRTTKGAPINLSPNNSRTLVYVVRDDSGKITYIIVAPPPCGCEEGEK